MHQNCQRPGSEGPGRWWRRYDTSSPSYERTVSVLLPRFAAIVGSQLRLVVSSRHVSDRPSIATAASLIRSVTCRLRRL